MALRRIDAAVNRELNMLDMLLLVSGLGVFAVLAAYVRACGQV